MSLRSRLEQNLPLKENELKLSKQASDFVFRGSFLTQGKIVDVESESNYSPSTSARFPYRHIVVRETSRGVITRHGWRINQSWDAFADSGLETVAELRNPSARRRANRIESIARRITLATGMILSSATIGTLGVAVIGQSPGPNRGTTIENCSAVIDGTEPLLPIDSTKVSVAQKVGETVCHIGSFDYELSPAP